MNGENAQPARARKLKAPWLTVLTIVLLAAGLFFRCYNLDRKVFWSDEVHSALWISGHSWKDIQSQIGNRLIMSGELLKYQRVNPERGLRHTVEVLAKGDPQHPPLYYVMLRLWTVLFGESIWVIRSLSVVANLLLFPCLFWLCRELFPKRRVAWLALIIVSVSPFHLMYAQEARQYSLWATIIVFSSASLLAALRTNAKAVWLLYALSIVFGLYVHTLFGMVIISHGIYVLWQCHTTVGLKSLFRWRPAVFYVLSTAIGLLAFSPWFRILSANLSTARDNLSWTTQHVSLFHLIGMWGFNFSALFLDANNALEFVESFDAWVILAFAIRAAILILLIYSFYVLFKNQPPKTYLFIALMIVIPMMALGLPDLILGGARSGWGYRYLAPAFIAVELAVAYALVIGISAKQSSSARKAWQGVIAAVVLCGITSCIISAISETWWSKSLQYYAPRMARMINEAKHPLLIADPTSNLLSISHRLKPSIKTLVVTDPQRLTINEDLDTVFVLRPSLSLQSGLKRNVCSRLDVVDRKGELYRCVPSRAGLR